MSRGRPRHQGSRRRTYSRRKSEIKPRQGSHAHDDHDLPGDRLAAIEVEESLETELPGPWRLPSRIAAG